MNNPFSTATVQVMRSRQSAIHDQVNKLMQENKGWSYDMAYNAAKNLPELKAEFDAMQQPATSPEGEPRNAKQAKAAAQFAGKVQAAAHARGISYDACWAAMQAEEPELFAAMRGNSEPGVTPFVTKVYEAMRAGGVNYDAAFAALQKSEPALFQEHRRSLGIVN